MKTARSSLTAKTGSDSIPRGGRSAPDWVQRVLTSCMAALTLASCSAQINTDIIEQNKAGLHKQATDEAWKRAATLPPDWAYNLGDGVTTRQISFYLDGGTALYGKMFFPKGFSRNAKYAAIVVGHGINAISIGIEKYASRFAERGFVAMAIDYVSYGYSSSEIALLEPDTTTDANPVTLKVARIQLKRTDLNNFHEIDDFRAAVSYLR